jgi:hypothetical protein
MFELLMFVLILIHLSFDPEGMSFAAGSQALFMNKIGSSNKTCCLWVSLPCSHENTTSQCRNLGKEQQRLLSRTFTYITFRDISQYISL